MLEKHEIEKRNTHTGDNESSGEDRRGKSCIVLDDLPTINTDENKATQN